MNRTFPRIAMVIAIAGAIGAACWLGQPGAEASSNRDSDAAALGVPPADDQPPSLDDRSGILTRRVNGIETKTTFILKRRLRIWAEFVDEGTQTSMVVVGVDPSGPAAHLRDQHRNVVGSMEPGDVIVSFEGVPIHSWTDYIGQMNKQNHPYTSKIEIRDINTGVVNDFVIDPTD